MGFADKNLAVTRYFMRYKPTIALFKWLMFRLYATETKSAREIAVYNATPSIEEVLSFWGCNKTRTLPSRRFYYLLLCLFAGSGFVSMAGVLTYSGAEPINIWIPLALFAFLPFMLTLFSAFSALLAPGRFQIQRHPLFNWVLIRMNFNAFLPYQQLLVRWAFWQVQPLTIVLLLSSLLSFFVLGTFQSFSFGWSSTFIHDASTFKSVMQIVTYPWHWLVESPSQVLIESTQLGLTSIEQSSDGIWWPTLMMAIVFYGILPRWLLSSVLKIQFINALKRDIAESSDMSQLLNAIHHQTTLNALPDENKLPEPKPLKVSDHDYDVISWRQSIPTPNLVKTLGQGNWAGDESWLSSDQCCRTKPVLVAVQILQTPTGELEDCFKLIQKKNSKVSLIILTEQSAQSREDELMASWLHFVVKLDIPVFIDRGTHAGD